MFKFVIQPRRQALCPIGDDVPQVDFPLTVALQARHDDADGDEVPAPDWDEAAADDDNTDDEADEFDPEPSDDVDWDDLDVALDDEEPEPEFGDFWDDVFEDDSENDEN